ncbi:hypothetical protein ACOBQB_19040 [Streptomyces sp. G5(2025)]|uniref:hypothetical protein n=1 Tax=Streptomyces sp. G5(2025) TaxID=3406628 RepID=UPI003C1E2ED6
MRHRTQHQVRLCALALALPLTLDTGRATPDTIGPAPSSPTSASPAGPGGGGGRPRV